MLFSDDFLADSSLLISIFYGFDSCTLTLSGKYLATSTSQSFLDIGYVSHILDVINLCLQLYRVVEQEDGTPNPLELECIIEV